MTRYLALDVGTTSLKAAMVDDTGRLLASASARYATRRPRPNHVEHDPEDWWRALVEALGVLAERVRLTEVRSIGLSGMAATHVLVDSTGHVLRPAILWQDTRAAQEAQDLAESLGSLDPLALFGANIDMTASMQASRMLWLHRHEPAVLDRAHAILGSKDYLAYRLTNAFATDHTSVAGFASLRTGDLHQAVVRRTGFDPEKLPQRLAPYELAGEISDRAAHATGLPAGTPVAIGMIDSWCNMLGSGLSRPGDAFDVAGTAEVIGIADHHTQAPSPSTAAVSRLPFLTGVDAVYGVTQCGTDALTWFAESFGEAERARAEGGSPSPYEQLVATAAEAPMGGDGLLFLPFLEGERSPFNDPRMRAGFLGVQRSHRKGHFVRAVLEGIAFSVRHVLEASEAQTSVRASEVRVSSGGAQSRLWNQIKADVLGRAVAQLRVTDAGSIGAAILAAVAVGDMDLHDAVERLVHVHELIEPNARASTRYDALFSTYRTAIEGTGDLMHELASWRDEGS